MLYHSLSSLCIIEKHCFVADPAVRVHAAAYTLISAVTACFMLDLQSNSRLPLTDLSDHPADVSGGYLVEFELGQDTDEVQNINLTR